MRAYRKRAWSSLVINMTPLIDVVFLIIIFFIMMINFSEFFIRKITLPNADEANDKKTHVLKEISITVKSEELIFLDRKKVSLQNLEDELMLKVFDAKRSTAQLRGDGNVSYDIIQQIMEMIALAGIRRIEFSTRKEPVTPLEKDVLNEASEQSN
jgi:biopolymer transport protein ExbD